MIKFQFLPDFVIFSKNLQTINAFNSRSLIRSPFFSYGIDLNLLRKEKGGDPDKVKESVKKRFQNPKIVDDVIAIDEQWRKLKFNADQYKKQLNMINKKIGEKKKTNPKYIAQEEVTQKQEIDKQIKIIESSEQDCLQNLNVNLSKIGNIVHESVPVDNNEDKNAIVGQWGKLPDFKINGTTPGRCHHHQILYMIDGYEPKRGQKVAGHRGYYLKNSGVLLNYALIHFGLKFLIERGYTPCQTPFFMKKEVMAQTCQLSDFDEQLYKVTGGPTLKSESQSILSKSADQAKQKPNEDGQDMYLIATSEQPLSGLHQGEWLEEKALPLKYGGISTCFRKEAGAHGKQVWGIFRVHQFEKVEQFVLCRPEDSWKLHEEMCQISQEFLQLLELPYRVVSIVSGALNDAAAKKYDIEAWFPGYEKYMELVSCSNCTDYQSRALEVRCGNKKANKNEKKYVHMLNGTLCATQRTLCCILENYQQEKGVKVPKVLIPYVGRDFIEYKKPIPGKNDME